MALGIRPLALFAALGSGAVLAAAFAFQYLGGLAPCQMCLWQRWPHAAALVIGAAVVALGARAATLLGAAAMAVGAGLGLFHVGVEQGWWEGVTACASGTNLDGITADELMAQILNAPIVRCDEIPWSFAGLSMAGWNMVLSAALMAVWLAAFAGRQHQRRL
ncbi:MAG: disulfide bond formation protein B [Pseudomonadota bacterium]